MTPTPATSARRSVPPEVMDMALALINTLASNTAFRRGIAEEEIAQRIADGDLIEAEKLSLGPGLVLVPRGRVPELEAAAKRVVNAWLDIPGEQGWTDEEVVLSRAVKSLAALFDVDDLDSDPDADTTGGDDTPAEDVAVERDTDEPDDSSSGPSDEGAKPEPEPEDVAVERDTEPNRDSGPSNEGRKPMIDQVSGDKTVTSDASGSATRSEGDETGNDEQGKPRGMPDAGDKGPCEQCGATINEPEQARLAWILTRQVLCRGCHIDGGDTEPPHQQEEHDGDPGGT